MKSGLTFMLAAGFEEKVDAARDVSVGTQDLLIGLTIALGLGLLLVVWIYWRFRRRAEEQDQERLARTMQGQAGRRSSAGRPDDEEESGVDGRRRSRKRRRRRAHRARNPSLSETGGLPPVRPDGELPKY